LKLVALIVVAGLVGCSRSGTPILTIRDPCSTFCAEYAPDQTPRLVRSGGQLLLRVSFTPAENNEASAVYAAVKRGPTILRVERTGREFIAQQACNGCIEIYVDSPEQAEAILLDLCFKKEESKLPLPPNA
jgi:hypothetical protein